MFVCISNRRLLFQSTPLVITRGDRLTAPLP